MTNVDAAPTSAAERVELMDVLRGVALFGVFLMNLVQFASVNVMSTEQQLLSLPTAPLDLTLFDVLDWLFADGSDSRELVRQKDMLFSLEAGVDVCEDAMEVIRSVVVKNG